MKAVVCSLTLFFTSLALAQPNPDTVWTRRIGDEHSQTFWGLALLARDSGLVSAGIERDITTNTLNCYFAALTESGEVDYARSEGRLDWGEGIYDIAASSDGGFGVCGVAGSTTHQSDALIALCDSAGTITDYRLYGGEEYDMFRAIQQTSDGGYVAVGYSLSFDVNDTDGYFVKVDSGGNEEWHTTFGGGGIDVFTAVLEAWGGGYLVTGSGHGWNSQDIWVAKFDIDGNVEWYRIHGGPYEDAAYAIAAWGTFNGGFLLGGSFQFEAFGQWDGYLLQVDTDGDTIWTRTLDETEYITTIRSLGDGGCYVSGSATTETGLSGFLARVDRFGNTQWYRTYEMLGIGAINDFLVLDDGSIIAAATTDWHAPNSDFVIFRTGPDQTVSADERNSSLIPSPLSLSVAPNPFNATTQLSFTLPLSSNVRLTVFDLLGREVSVLHEGRLEAGPHTRTLNGESLATGVYIARLTGEGVNQSAKLLLMK